MNITESTASVIEELWSSVEPRIAQSKTLEEAAQVLATALHRKFEESVVLARVFFTVPFLSLPQSNIKFVKQLAESADAGSDLKPTTPVLSLIGTHGQAAEWNNRHNSKGHVGIPLISSAFVDAIPMISRLLKELGVPMQWIDSHDSKIIKDTIGRTSGLFLVEDAGTATDHEGRKIIVAQEFVSGYNVKSVFGVGSAYPSGQIAVTVLFCRDSISRETAEQFLAFADSFQDKTKGTVGSAKIFSSAA